MRNNITQRTPAKMLTKTRLAAVISLIFAGFSHAAEEAEAAAQHATNDELEVIQVTANKRTETIQEVASSISAISAMELSDKQIITVSELSQHVPNLHIFTWGGRRDTNIFIRGIGPGLFTEPMVGFYVDGVNYTGNGSFDLDLFDIQSVEVLRGPQGTLYGGNSAVGVINITTRQPDDELTVDASFARTDLDRSEYKARIAGALIDGALYGSFAGSWVKDDGHIENLAMPGNIDERDDLTLTSKLTWLVNDEVKATLSMDKIRFRGGSYAFTPLTENPVHDQVSHDIQGVDDQDTFAVAANVEWQTDNWLLTSVTGWRDWQNRNSSDSDGNAIPLLKYHGDASEEQKQFSQEIRVASNGYNDAGLQWLVGGYYYDSELDTDSVNDIDFRAFGWGGPFQDKSNSTQKKSGLSFFANLDYQLADQWVVTAGLRHEDESRDVVMLIDSQTQASGLIDLDRDFSQWLPKFAVKYTTSSDDLWYFSVSKGYRAGGFDVLYPDLASPEYESETSLNYEFGVKYRLFDNSLTINASLFQIDLTDQQVQVLLSDGKIVTDNAGESQSQGLELEMKYIPATGWLVDAGVSLTNAEYQVYSTAIVGQDGMPVDVNYAGNELPLSADIQTNLGIQNRTELNADMGLFSRVEWVHVGDHYFDPANQFKQDAFTLMNAKFGLESESWDLYLVGKNLTDKRYKSIAFDQGFGPMTEYAEGRSVGITFNYRY